MKLLFVADNSPEQNWGCRATSFALRRMVAERHEITGAITRALGAVHEPSHNIEADAALLRDLRERSPKAGARSSRASKRATPSSSTVRAR